MLRYAVLVLVSILSIGIFAQYELEDSSAYQGKKDAFKLIEHSVGTAGGRVLFHQDPRIELLINENKSSGTKELQGFRVQVFSSNAQRTAKDEAFSIEQRLVQAFPSHKVYVTYTSPFWKVRLGDFIDQESAKEFTEELLQKFPALRKDTYTVRERITVLDK